MSAQPAAAAGTITIGGELTVNRMGYGAMQLTGPGIWGLPRNLPEAVAVLRRAVELGVQFIDTADAYGPDINEDLIAEALAPYPPGLVIASKAGWKRTGPGQWIHDASPVHLRQACEGSLRRLRLERIDLFQLHVPDARVSFDASVEALAELREQGKIRMVGLSNVTREHVERARQIVPIVSVQNRYSFADREWDYVLAYCEQNGIAFMPWAPLDSGNLAYAAAARIAARHQASPYQVAIAWLLKRSPNLLAIPGTASVKHVEENIAAATLQLSDDEYGEMAGEKKKFTTRK